MEWALAVGVIVFLICFGLGLVMTILLFSVFMFRIIIQATK